MSIDLNKLFGRAMKTWRTGQDLSQAQVAGLLNISQAGYSKIESGAVDTGLSQVAKALEVTGLPLSALLSPQGSAEASGAEPSLPDMILRVLNAGYRVEKKD